MKPYFFAAIGDVHGRMNRMHALLREWCESSGNTLEYVLQVGDFEPHRDEQDLATMAAPARYRQMGDFQEYVSGSKHFEWPTYFIGGNHEPYGFLDTIPLGGEIIKNCHYLGRVVVKEMKGLRMGGLSGIFIDEIYQEGRAPLSELSKTSNKAYIGFTEDEVFQLLEMEPVDILLLHEWPIGLIREEDEALFQGKRRATDIGSIGNEPARLLIDLLKPKLVFCGHMHRQYERVLRHSDDSMTKVYCLPNIHAGLSACAFFSVDEMGQLSKVDPISQG